MKKVFFLLVVLFYSTILWSQRIETFVNRQMQTYPKSRLIDIYKSCFQDYMGAEHLVSDRQRVKDYLNEELQNINLDELMPWYYEPCGIDSNYWRVSLRVVIEGFITEEQLLDAFLMSAHVAIQEQHSVDSWRLRWECIVYTIERMGLHIPHYSDDYQYIDNILSQGKYAVSHSPEYREAYHPHYRIVRRDIFEQSIKPLIQ